MIYIDKVLVISTLTMIVTICLFQGILSFSGILHGVCYMSAVSWWGFCGYILAKLK